METIERVDDDELLTEARLEAGRLRDAASGGGKKSQAQQIVEQVLGGGMKLFHTPAGKAFAQFSVNDHQETWRVRASVFAHHLRRTYYATSGRAANAHAIGDARDLIESHALFEGATVEVYTRIAAPGGDVIYIDLCDNRWRVVEVTPAGWRVLDSPPVYFRRAGGMLPLPAPERGGSVNELRPFVNVAGDDDWALVLAWLVAALRGRGPFPLLALHGEQGSAKSTLSRLLRSLSDPNTAAVRAAPREPRDLAIAAANSWVAAFDNLSFIPPWLSDALCRLSTGGGFATRELWTDSEEAIFDAQRPVIVNGIEELATRGDLVDRAINISSPAIRDEDRQPESAFWRDFEGAQPRILGALLDAVSRALRDLPHVRLDRLPRMADFAQWAVAAEPALGLKAGTFLAAYDANRRGAVELVLESSLVAPVLMQFITNGGEWSGTAGKLLDSLDEVADDRTKRRHEWPGSPRALSGVLRRLAPDLRKKGIEVIFVRADDRNRTRIVRIGPSEPSTASERQAFSSVVSDGLDASPHRYDGPPSTRTAQDPGALDRSDGSDGRIQPLSAKDLEVLEL